MFVERQTRFSRLLTNFAGWFGKHRRRSVTNTAVMAAPLAMTSVEPLPIDQRSHVSGSGAPAMRPIIESRIVVVSLPAGYGWSNHDVPAPAASSQPEVGAAATQNPAFDVTRNSTCLSCALPASGAPLDSAPAQLLATLPALEPSISCARPAVSPSALPALVAEPIRASRGPLLLARQLRGVARLNQPTARCGKAPPSTPNRHHGRVDAMGRRNLVAALDRQKPQRTDAGTAVPSRGAVRLPKAQPWILSRSSRQ